MTLRLIYKTEKGDARSVRANWRGCSAEYVMVPGQKPYEFTHAGELHYLALHDLRLRDGVLNVDTKEAVRALDLRDTITFVPKGCALSGWAEPTEGNNAFIAVHFEPAMLHEELEARYVAASPEPLIYARDRALQSTLTKLQSLVTDSAWDSIRAEGLCLLAAIEVTGIVNGPSSGRLSDRLVERLRDYVDANLDKPLSLDDMAKVVGLSRFHFTRAFKAATGHPPYQYVAGKRVEAARRILASNDLPISAVAAKVGLSVSQLRRAFMQHVGMSPNHFRRDGK